VFEPAPLLDWLANGGKGFKDFKSPDKAAA
jgi:hypothetical protein